MLKLVVDVPHICFDLDGTLVIHDKSVPFNPDEIGEPIPEMMALFKETNKHVQARVFTARATRMRSSSDVDYERRIKMIQNFMFEQTGIKDVPVVNYKTYNTIQLVDDRAVQVIANTGKHVTGKPLSNFMAYNT